ncbi:MAG: AMP-binding protein, partial [Gammaproteobacteria bacterium]|nr:AMP-binding protein [Gammaproteobacteria bacterium]
TTGKPKGVVLEHTNMSSFIQHGALCMYKDLGPGSRFLLSSPMTFDVSYGIQFPTFSMGATLVLVPKSALLDELELLINTVKVSSLVSSSKEHHTHAVSLIVFLMIHMLHRSHTSK